MGIAVAGSWLELAREVVFAFVLFFECGIGYSDFSLVRFYGEGVYA